MNVIGIDIDRETGRVTGADTPSASADIEKMINRLLRPGTLFEMYIDCLGGDGLEQERVRKHGRRSGTVPAIQGIHAEHDPLREPPAGQQRGGIPIP